jgi:RNA polymerase sporulation-specific sigma factor
MGSLCVEPPLHINQSDISLLRLAAIGNSNATEALLARYRYLVESKARNYFLIGADHDDVVQEGMIGLYKAIRDFRYDRASCFRSFADLCVTRQIISAVKMATRNKHLPLNAYISLYRSPGGDPDSEMRLVDCIADTLVPSPYDMLFERCGAMGRLESARSALSGLEQRVLECYLQGKSYREMAVELRRSSKTIDNALQRVKRKILESFAP